MGTVSSPFSAYESIMHSLSTIDVSSVSECTELTQQLCDVAYQQHGDDDVAFGLNAFSPGDREILDPSERATALAKAVANFQKNVLSQLCDDLTNGKNCQEDRFSLARRVFGGQQVPLHEHVATLSTIPYKQHTWHTLDNVSRAYLFSNNEELLNTLEPGIREKIAAQSTLSLLREERTILQIATGILDNYHRLNATKQETFVAINLLFNKLSACIDNGGVFSITEQYTKAYLASWHYQLECDILPTARSPDMLEETYQTNFEKIGNDIQTSLNQRLASLSKQITSTPPLLEELFSRRVAKLLTTKSGTLRTPIVSPILDWNNQKANHIKVQMRRFLRQLRHDIGLQREITSLQDARAMHNLLQRCMLPPRGDAEHPSHTASFVRLLQLEAPRLALQQLKNCTGNTRHSFNIKEQLAHLEDASLEELHQLTQNFPLISVPLTNTPEAFLQELRDFIANIQRPPLASKKMQIAASCDAYDFVLYDLQHNLGDDLIDYKTTMHSTWNNDERMNEIFKLISREFLQKAKDCDQEIVAAFESCIDGLYNQSIIHESINFLQDMASGVLGITLSPEEIQALGKKIFSTFGPRIAKDHRDLEPLRIGSLLQSNSSTQIHLAIAYDPCQNKLSFALASTDLKKLTLLSENEMQNLRIFPSFPGTDYDTHPPLWRLHHRISKLVDNTTECGRERREILIILEKLMEMPQPLPVQVMKRLTPYITLLTRKSTSLEDLQTAKLELTGIIDDCYTAPLST